MSSSPDTQQKNVFNNINNNNNVNCSNNNNNNIVNNDVTTTKKRCESTSDAADLSKMDRLRFGSIRTLQNEEDRILKEMVR